MTEIGHYLEASSVLHAHNYCKAGHKHSADEQYHYGSAVVRRVGERHIIGRNPHVATSPIVGPRV